ncbi:bifunctional diguanylate cyclase/phosphodiesterase [[Clostridium] innocuum]|nr:bifunctional diguanylate cyclase/phosphodiesterase [[Clostridium] innocuum]
MQKNSLFRRLLITLTLTGAAICLIFMGTVFAGGTISNLKDISYHLFHQRVKFRVSDLQEIMATDLYQQDTYKELLQECEKVYHNAAAYQNSRELPASVLKQMDAFSKLKYITGSYVIFDKDVFHTDSYPAYYLTDGTPGDTYNDKSDIIARFGNASALKKAGYSLHSEWKTFMKLSEKDENDGFYFRPYQAAVNNPREEIKSYGYWGTSIRMQDNETEFITYSFPLISSEHQVYGVAGVEISLDFLKKYLPYEELNDDSSNAYLLACKNKNTDTYEVVYSNGPNYRSLFPIGKKFELEDAAGERGSTLTVNDRLLVMQQEQLHLYESNTPFVEQEWYLIGTLEYDALYSSAIRLQKTILWTMLGSILLAFIIALFTSMKFSHPIAQLAKVLKNFDPNDEMHLPRVKVLEVDELASSIEELSRNLSTAESRLSQVIHALDMPIDAIEVYDSGLVYCTEEIPHLLCFHNRKRTSYTHKEFVQEIEVFKKRIEIFEEKEEWQDGRQVHTYVISHQLDEHETWLRFILSQHEGTHVIVVMDVSDEIREKRKLTYERDHDVLTQLFNRRAFRSRVEAILSGDACGICAMILWDLDNLKVINDTYGHDAGDQLICATARYLQKLSSSRCIVSRMAGDEFLVFFHHYQKESEIRTIVEGMHRQINAHKITFTGKEEIRIRLSAGIAWYPKDAQDFDTLSKYADFAMYSIKSTQKGGIEEFQPSTYHKDKLLLSGRNELNEILDHNLVSYAYQPIVHLKSKEIYAFEALMRPRSTIITSPVDILRVARSQSQLYRVEFMTWTQSIAQFADFHSAFPKTRLFINSIPSIPMLDDLTQSLEQQYKEYLPLLVIEMIETDEIEQHYLETKQQFAKRWDAHIAIDDFGSGYSNDSTLLNVAANYIKIDMMFVRDIHKDENRQRLVENMITFAHRQHIRVIAEGVETKEELQQLIRMDVDFVQGYYLGKPALQISDICEADIRRKLSNL